MKVGRTTTRAWRWMRSRFSRNALILLYHRVCDDGDDPFGLSVTPMRFEEQMRLLTSRYRVVPLDALASDVINGSVVPGTVAVTFDDGYEDNLTTAKPILEQTGVPATIFVISGELGREFWWDALVRLVHRTPELPAVLEVSGRPFAIPPAARRGTAAARRRLLLALHSLLIDQPLVEIRAAIAALAAQLREPPTTPQHRSASPSLLRSTIRAQDSIEIGAHTVSHPVLSRLEPDEQYKEIFDCKTQLEALLGRRVASFSYPYGQPGQYNSDSLKHVRNAGFHVACTVGSDTVRATSDPMRLPRIWIRNAGGDAFGRLLQRWTGV